MVWQFTLDNINDVANSFWKALGSATVVALHGSMGVGKTTFVHALCDVKNVKDVVGSPTFSIINEYSFLENGQERKLYHIDLYRLKNEEEAIQAGVEDCLYSEHICVVEWPDRAPGLLPDDSIHAYIDPINEKTRRLRIGNN